MKNETQIDPKAREVETRRIGTQNRLKERVADVRENAACKRARDARFAATGEPTRSGEPLLSYKSRPETPGTTRILNEAILEKKASAQMTGGKAVHSGAFDSLEEVPPMFSVKKRK